MSKILLSEQECDKIFFSMFLKTITKENHGGTVSNVNIINKIKYSSLHNIVLYLHISLCHQLNDELKGN